MIILILVLCIILCCFSFAVALVAHRAVLKNFALEEQIKEHGEFFDVITSTLVEDTVFLRGEMARRFGAEIPEVRDMNKQIINFENKIIAIRDAIRTYKSGIK